MTGAKQTVRVYRDGDRIALDSVVDDPDYSGVVQTTWFEPRAGIEIGEAMARLGWMILAETPA